MYIIDKQQQQKNNSSLSTTMFIVDALFDFSRVTSNSHSLTISAIVASLSNLFFLYTHYSCSVSSINNNNNNNNYRRLATTTSFIALDNNIYRRRSFRFFARNVVRSNSHSRNVVELSLSHTFSHTHIRRPTCRGERHRTERIRIKVSKQSASLRTDQDEIQNVDARRSRHETSQV